jgi:hypothetical protein
VRVFREGERKRTIARLGSAFERVGGVGMRERATREARSARADVAARVL